MSSVQVRGDALTQRRIRAGHSVTSLAARVGTSRAHLSNVESGKRAPSPELAHRLATELGAAWGRLFRTTTARRTTATPAATGTATTEREVTHS